MSRNNDSDLDWWASSERGGAASTDGNGEYWDSRDRTPRVRILGDRICDSTGHRQMWGWQSLRQGLFADLQRVRKTYPEKVILSAFEWNMPGHEQATVGIVAPNTLALSLFEYQFDNEDIDQSLNGLRSRFGVLSKRNGKVLRMKPVAPGRLLTEGDDDTYFERCHRNVLTALEWLKEQARRRSVDDAWVIISHPEKAGPWSPSSGGGYNIEHFRDFNNAAPNICFGFEGAPGHQAATWRGFGNPVDATTGESVDFGGTYGGVGYYTAKIGGVWDALLGEGRRWFVFANSDYRSHYTAGGDDFHPGEYQKNWIYAARTGQDGEVSAKEVVDGLRSGRSWFAHGDLIDYLDFSVSAERASVASGGELVSPGQIPSLVITIRFRSPAANHCMEDDALVTSCSPPRVHHIDLISGAITGKLPPDDPDYTRATNPTTKVIATFTSQDWQQEPDGTHVITYRLDDLTTSTYFRLRGTNLAPNTPYETDETGNPLPDHLATTHLGIDGAREAWQDLWFYSNPIFVHVGRTYEVDSEN
ncbi:MAG: hypothetical protein AB9873_12510 [Syntrophobacteraceae bacterium]